jgi:hypothetical protein
MLEEGGDQVAKQGLSMRGVPAQVSVFASSAGHIEELEVGLGGEEGDTRVDRRYRLEIRGQTASGVEGDDVRRIVPGPGPIGALPPTVRLQFSALNLTLVLFSWIYSQANSYIFVNTDFVPVATIGFPTNQATTRQS